MDTGFVNSILRANFFPPKDMWFTPFPINYYYFGHLVTAVLTKLSNLPSNVTFNLMIATLCSFTFVASFSIGVNLAYSLRPKLHVIRHTLYAVPAGLLVAFLVTFSGNLHTLYTLFKPYTGDPVPPWQLAFSPGSFPNGYWYPNATRFIYHTIHEFPAYSFIVSDLHGHLTDVPFVLLTIAILLSVFKNLDFEHSLKITNFKLKIPLIGFLLAVMYMTNAWDGFIYFLLAALVVIIIFFKQKPKGYILNSTYFILSILIGFFIFSLPFSLTFKPFVSGIGVICAPKFLTGIGHLGPFLFEAGNCQRSPLYQLGVLYGFFYIWVVAFLIFLFHKPSAIRHKLLASDIFVLLLIFISTVLIIIPEFFYIKDIYATYYRANTMFKLVYESFIMLSISSGYIIIRIITGVKKLFAVCCVLFAIPLVFFVSIYPVFGVNSYYDSLKTYHGLDGTNYLKALYPTDYQAILWINAHIKNQPVIAEAVGDAYTDFARESANTGLPTLLGWPTHEWLWRGTYDIPSPRIAEVKTFYETQDLQTAKNILQKYNVAYVFVGDLERQKYPALSEEKFKSLGQIIYQNGNTRIYKIFEFKKSL
ncbi:MAG TPA: DUF2298 domain-containing protein, partial [Candidatus Saccharimonadales bacterium]|nr:DUF2298 domain-containing protein [Candidatus Saccharimonadales bacterium]